MCGICGFIGNEDKSLLQKMLGVLSHRGPDDEGIYFARGRRRGANGKAVGGENELLPRGLDPYLRQAFREAGLRVIVVPGVIYHHLPPDSWDKLLKQFFRNGRQAAYCNKLYPQWVIETPNKHQKKFREKVSLPFRMVRYMWRVLRGVITFRWIYVLASLSYLVGFICGYLTLKNQPTFTK